VLTLIHTNDFHGRLRPPVSGRLRSVVEAEAGDLLLDAGDAVTAGNLGIRPGGEPILPLMSELGYAAMTVGNRETHPRKEVFPHKVAGARFPILSANLTPKAGAANPTTPHALLERNGIRIGVVGVTVPMFTRKQWSQALCDYWFTDPIVTMQQQARLLRPQVELLVALTHIGFRRDCELAERCPELDLVVGGHSHTRLEAPEWRGACAVVQAYCHAFYAGVGRIEIEAGRGRLRGWKTVPLREDSQ